MAIQDHLTDDAEFTYDDDVPSRDDSCTILDFLTTTKRGFCQQFASAMAVMLRTLGYPRAGRGRLHARGARPQHRARGT